MDTLLLSRVQLGTLTAFHLLFPAVTLALGWVLVAFRLQSGPRAGRAFRLWMPVYALSMAFQVVSGWALWSQFNMTWPAFMEQASAVAIPLRVADLIGTGLQILPLAVAAYGIRSLSSRLVTGLIVASALGGVFTMLSSVVLLTWMVEPVGTLATYWQLTTADWVAVLGNRQVWTLALFLGAASGITTGLLMAGLSMLRWQAGAQDGDADATAKAGLMLASISAAAVLGLTLASGPRADLLALVTVVSVTASAMLLRLRHPESGLADLPVWSRAALFVLPAGGWAILLVGWPFDRMLNSVWLIHGQMRMDEAAAVLPPGTVTATLPVYLATIAVLVLSYFAVLAVIAWREQASDAPRYPRSAAQLQGRC